MTLISNWVYNDINKLKRFDRLSKFDKIVKYSVETCVRAHVSVCRIKNRRTILKRDDKESIHDLRTKHLQHLVNEWAVIPNIQESTWVRYSQIFNLHLTSAKLFTESRLNQVAAK